MSMVDDEQQSAIDTSDDNSGAAPVSGTPTVPAEDDSTGVDQAQRAPQQAPQENQSRSGLDFNAAHVPGNMKRIVSYLMGAHADPPQTIDQVGAEIDPQGQMHPSDRNLLAISHVRDSQGDNAAWQLLQANRVAYNAQTAFAKTALEGTRQKPADIKAAVDAANKAQANVPDGSKVHFTPSQQGVTATVTMPGTSQAQTINLTPQQFSQFLDVGGDGQWDKIHEASAPATLQRIASSGGQAQSPARSQGITKLSQMRPLPKAAAPANSGTVPEPAEPQTEAPVSKAVRTGQPQAMDVTQGDQPPIPGTHDANGHAIGQPPADTTGYGDELEARSRRIFPSVGQEAERNQWMAAQEEKELGRQNAVQVATEKGKWADKRAETAGGYHLKGNEATAAGRVEAAKLYSGAKRDAAMAANAAKIKQLEQSGANKQEEGQRKLAQTYISTGQPVPPHLQQYLETGTDQALAAQRGAQPQQRAPAAPQQGQPPVPGAKLYKGQWYTRGPNGESMPVH